MVNFNILVEKGEDGYLVSEVIELPGCHTQAKGMDELLKRTKEAILLYLKVEGKTVNENFLGVQRLEI